MISLCEKCFPGWRDVEVITVPPMVPCASCGVWDSRNKPEGISVHTFHRDPRRPEPAQLMNPANVSIEGVPIKEVMIDAICGAGCAPRIWKWASDVGLADFGDQYTAPSWDRDRLNVLELDALFAVYGRVKRK